MPVMPTLRRLRQGNHRLQYNLGYKGRSCLKKKEQILSQKQENNNKTPSALFCGRHCLENGREVLRREKLLTKGISQRTAIQNKQKVLNAQV